MLSHDVLKSCVFEGPPSGHPGNKRSFGGNYQSSESTPQALPGNNGDNFVKLESSHPRPQQGGGGVLLS